MDNGYYFNGSSEDNLIIFYPGAKAEYTAYARLLHMLALRGVDTFMVKMPYNLAILLWFILFNISISLDTHFF